MVNSDDFQDLQKAYSLHKKGSLGEAAKICRRLIAANPQNYQALHFLGAVEAASGNFESAKSLMALSLSIQPPNIEFLENYAALLFNSNDYKSALDACARGFRIQNKNLKLLYISAISLYKIDRLSESLKQFDRIIAYQPNHVAALSERGVVLAELKQLDAALVGFDKALSLDPRYAPAYLNKGNAYVELGRFDDALAAYNKALALKPGYADVWHGLGNVLIELKRYEEALVAYDKALAVKSDFAKAWHGRGNALNHLKRHDQAASAYAKVLDIAPQFEFTKGLLLHEKMLACDWERLDRLADEIERDVTSGRLSADPFGWQAISKSDRSLQSCAELYCKRRFPANVRRLARPASGGTGKIRVGYSSGEFRQHATSLLLAGVLELHDEERFEIYAVDNGSDDRSATRRRVADAVHGFIDIKSMNDSAAAAAIRDKQIEILVNLNGYFGEARMGVFAQRPAAIQVNYLGFPGTLGAHYMDYILADRTVIPATQKQLFTEKVVYLPHSYQANDRKKEIDTYIGGRAEYGLPERDVVFCCFNNSFKITPEIFDVWMRILKKIDGSVLWLLEDNETAPANLKKEAEVRGLNAGRLVFAKRRPLAEHLARQRCADLFLDTLPYNAHTTASDALWAGLPLLTCLGTTFAGRVAASLLTAMDMPELIAATLAEYEQMAIELATHPAKLAEIRQRLSDNRLATPLFDTRQFTTHLEAAYTAMYERHRAGLAPDHIDVPSS